ncbi:MAG: cupin domain-containing protein [Planctomycetaceae bacterium]
MPYFNIDNISPLKPLPGCRLRTPYGENLMLSHVDLDAGAVIPLHQHPHEQGGIVLKGRLELTIGDEVRILEAGEMYIIPPNTLHKAMAVDGPAVALDVFTPVREDYARMANDYIPAAADPSNHSDD